MKAGGMFFTLGSVIVKSSHLHAWEGVQDTDVDFSYANANEIRATALAKVVLEDVKITGIYIADKVSILVCD